MSEKPVGKVNTIKSIILVSLFSSVFIGAGVYLLMKGQELAKEGIKTTAVCVDFRYSTSTEDNSDTTAYPIVEFETIHGDKIKTDLDYGEEKDAHRIGDKIAILYLEEDPINSAAQDDDFQRSTGPWLIIGIGILIEMILIPIVLAVRKKEKEEEELLRFSEGTRDNDDPFRIS